MVRGGKRPAADVRWRRVVGKRKPGPPGPVPAALEHAAVDEDPGASGVEEVLRPRDRGRAAEEVEVHPRSVQRVARIRRRDGPRADYGSGVNENEVMTISTG